MLTPYAVYAMLSDPFIQPTQAGKTSESTVTSTEAVKKTKAPTSDNATKATKSTGKTKGKAPTGKK